jgi:hypothetical protein
MAKSDLLNYVLAGQFRILLKRGGGREIEYPVWKC